MKSWLTSHEEVLGCFDDGLFIKKKRRTWRTGYWDHAPGWKSRTARISIASMTIRGSKERAKDDRLAPGTCREIYHNSV